jgi:hypothetical protein
MSDRSDRPPTPKEIRAEKPRRQSDIFCDPVRKAPIRSETDTDRCEKSRSDRKRTPKNSDPIGNGHRSVRKTPIRSVWTPKNTDLLWKRPIETTDRSEKVRRRKCPKNTEMIGNERSNADRAKTGLRKNAEPQGREI